MHHRRGLQHSRFLDTDADCRYCYSFESPTLTIDGIATRVPCHGHKDGSKSSRSGMPPSHHSRSSLQNGIPDMCAALGRHSSHSLRLSCLGLIVFPHRSRHHSLYSTNTKTPSPGSACPPRCYAWIDIRNRLNLRTSLTQHCILADRLTFMYSCLKPSSSLFKSSLPATIHHRTSWYVPICHR